MLEGVRHTVQPNALICFPPHTCIHYGCDTAGYNDDWIHFLPDAEESGLLEKLSIPLNRIVYPFDFHKLSEYVRMISDHYHSPSPHTPEILDAFMHVLLYSLPKELASRPATGNFRKYYTDFSRLRTQIYNDPAASRTVPGLAASLCLSLSCFQHLYREFFGISCRQDMILARLSLAKYYLKNSDMTIRALADFCGYENELHFMRQFKKVTGMTPSSFRRG